MNVSGTHYCDWCGNNQVTGDEPCERCALVLAGPLAAAKTWFDRIAAENSHCCSGIDSSTAFSERQDDQTLDPYLYFHGKHWNGTYPPEEERREGAGETWVEYGVRLHPDRAETYYCRDFGQYADSEVYGDPIPYSEPNFLRKLDGQLDQAPQAAWNADLLSCGGCGNHYYTPNGPCSCGAAEGEESEDEDAVLA